MFNKDKNKLSSKLRTWSKTKKKLYNEYWDAVPPIFLNKMIDDFIGCIKFLSNKRRYLELFGNFAVTNAVMLNITNQIELTPQQGFESPSDHLRKAKSTGLMRSQFGGNNKHNKLFCSSTIEIKS